MAQVTLLQGTLSLLVLRTLELGPLHGIGIADRIAQVTRGTFTVKPGSLFPALHRLEAEGWIESEWGTSASGYRAKLYTLTAKGRTQLAAEKRSWAQVSLAIQQVLEMS
jgi:transcriptional regulator